MEPINVPTYAGRDGPVVVLHGGPGAPGSAAGLAAALAPEFEVWEPLQRRSGDVEVSVDRHVADLHDVAPRPATIVGHSWGAMLGLSYAARHPAAVRAPALVGCGTYDTASRAEFERRFEARLDAADRVRRDVLRRQTEGVEPQAFDAIEAPVVMLHGDDDPHLGTRIRDTLLHYIPRLEYVGIPRCGHEPWRERHGRDPFLAALRAWLTSG